MGELRLPWPELVVLLPILGALFVKITAEPYLARKRSLLFSGLTFLCAAAASVDFMLLRSAGTLGAGDAIGRLLHARFFVLDSLSALLVPLAALIYFLTLQATLRTKVREFPFARGLVSEAIVLATFCCKLPWLVALLLVAETLPPFLELRSARKPTRVYTIHMLTYIFLLISGQSLISLVANGQLHTLGVLLLTGAVLLRCGVVPIHCWITDLFEHATFGTALLFVTPMVGAYGVLRLVLPVAPQWVFQVISLASLTTAVYAAGMALVQREARRFYCYLFLSNSSLVLVGIETATTVGLTGALSLWLSVALSLTGFGLTLRCIESRVGRLSIGDFQGLYHHIPMLAVLYLITGLASIGFPGTSGFVGLELLFEGALQAHPLVGTLVVMVTALNGLAVMQVYFRIFTGKPHLSSIDLSVRRAERIAVLVLTALIVGGGLFPQPGVTSLHQSAIELVASRARELTSPPIQPSMPPARHASAEMGGPKVPDAIALRRSPVGP
jgi:NADH-quinone oxidoreductase subunit M